MPVVAGCSGVVCSGVWRDMDVESKRHTDVPAASPEHTTPPQPATVYQNHLSERSFATLTAPLRSIIKIITGIITCLNRG